ncbi:MAG: phage tail tape measure protein [Firmicutes bacterium]|nr:phage tail tape measure protein [Bacillota bacterium]
MPDMIEVARATVTIIPNMSGAQQTITKEMDAAATSAGSSSGNKAGKSFGSSLKSTLSTVGKEMTKSLTVPIAAAGAGAVAAWKEVDEGLDTIVTKTGATGDSLAEMEDIMRNIATTIPTDFQTAGSAIGEVNTRFGVTGKQLEDLSLKFIKFAEINGTDVSNSVDSVSKAMAAWGLDASSAGDMLGALNMVGQNTGVSVDTLSSLLATNATQLQGLGLSAYDAAAFLGQVDMAGLDTGIMLKGLQSAMVVATEDGTSLSQVLSDFQGVMQGNGTEAEKLTVAYELFGTRAGGAIANAVENGTLDLETFGVGLSGFSNSVETTFDNAVDPLDQFNMTMNQLKLLGADIVTEVGPSIATALEKVGDVVTKITDWWHGLNEGTQKFILIAGGLIAVLGPLITTIMSMNPIVIAIIAVITAVVAVITHWGEISEWFRGVWDSVCTAVTNIWNNLKTSLSNTWNNIKNTATNTWEKVKEAITKPIEKAKEKISEIIDKIKGFFSGLKLELPKIKLPHFSLQGSFSLAPPSVPHLAIDWYAKAATQGAIFNQPTVIGVGDARQPEMLIGQDTLRDMIGEAIGERDITVNVYGAEGQSIKDLARAVVEEMQYAMNRKEAVYG